MNNLTVQSQSNWGKVVDITDPNKSGRIRVAVNGVYDTLPIDVIPWSLPRYQNRHTHDLPELDSIVNVMFMNDDMLYPMWWQKRGETDYHQLSEDDYESAIVFANKLLSKFNDDGHIRIEYTKTDGYQIHLTKSDKTSTMSIRADGSVFIKNGVSGHILHMSDKSMSLGSETESAEPGVLGDTNHAALNKLNDFTEQVTSVLQTGLQNLSTVAGGSPYTMSLKAPLSALKRTLKATVDKWHSDNSEFFKKTTSNIVTLD